MKTMIVLAVLLAGCATSRTTVGRNFDASGVGSIERGKTTRIEIEKSFGAPYGRTVTGTGETWTYVYLRSIGRATSIMVATDASGHAYLKNLSITFDTSGIVSFYSYSVTGDSTLAE